MLKPALWCLNRFYATKLVLRCSNLALRMLARFVANASKVMVYVKYFLGFSVVYLEVDFFYPNKLQLSNYSMTMHGVRRFTWRQSSFLKGFCHLLVSASEMIPFQTLRPDFMSLQISDYLINLEFQILSTFVHCHMQHMFLFQRRLLLLFPICINVKWKSRKLLLWKVSNKMCPHFVLIKDKFCRI